MLLSVVIPVYNGARSIGPLVESLTRDLDRWELQVVLVNDGSPDNSAEVCRNLAKRFPRSGDLRTPFSQFRRAQCRDGWSALCPW